MGLAERDAASLQKKWRLETDEIFALNRRNPSSAKRVAMEIRGGAEKQTIDVRIVLK